MSTGRGRAARHGDESTSPAPVRPRWVWGGLLLALVGTSVLGVGVAVLSWTVALAGGALLVLGAAASLRGGILHDAVRRPDLGDELRGVRDGDVHPGVGAGLASGPRARRDATETNHDTRELEAATRPHPGVRWAPAAGWLLLVTSAVVTTSQWALVAHTPTGRHDNYLYAGVAVVLGLAGLRVVTAPGRHPVAVGASLLGGLVLVVNGLLGEHDNTGPATVEVSCGILAALCAVVAWWGTTPRP